MLRSIKYSFVLPAFKGRFLEMAIHSILSQRVSDFELIVLDDCSPDELEKIVCKFSDKRIRYYRNNYNIGGKDLVRQWNTALSLANGEYIILASDDDIYDPEFLSGIEVLINEFPSASVFRPRITRIDYSGNTIKEEKWRHTELSKMISGKEFLSLYATYGLSSGIPQYAFKRADLVSIGGFQNLELAWYSDDLTIYKIAQIGGLALYNKPLFSFRIWKNSITGSKPSRETCLKKITATEKFYKAIKEDRNLYDIQHSVALRCQKVTADFLASCDVKLLLVCMFSMKGISSEVYPLHWRMKRIIRCIIENTSLCRRSK